MKRDNLLKGLLAAMIFSLLVVWGCHSGSSDDQRQAEKRELVLAVGGEPEAGFDPTTGWGRYGSPLFQSTLFKRDHRMNVVGDVATGYEISEDGLQWTVTLRDDIVFSDGEPLKADDVVYTYRTAAASNSVVDLTNLEQVEAVDDHTVRFRLKQPNSAFLEMLASIGIVPQHAHDQQYAEHPIGSGPYRLVQWDRGQQLIIEANPLYAGQQPYFQKVTFLFLSEDAALAAAKAGQVDVAAIPASLAKQPVTGMKLVAVQTVDNRGIMFPVVPTGGKTLDGLPIGNDVTADPAIRKAINLAVDRQKLVDGVLEGYGTPAFSISDGMPWFNPETAFRDGDTEGAMRLLEEAGWVDRDGDGIREKGELKARFPLYYPAGDRVRQGLALAVAEMIRSVGIDIDTKGASWQEIGRNMHSAAVLFGWGSHDPLEMYYVHSSRFQGQGYYNPGFYANETVDRYMELALRSRTEEEANRYWQLAQWDGKTGLSALGDAPWAWLVNVDHVYLVREELDIGKQKIHPHGHGWPITDNITEWTWLIRNKGD